VFLNRFTYVAHATIGENCVVQYLVSVGGLCFHAHKQTHIFLQQRIYSYVHFSQNLAAEHNEIVPHAAVIRYPITVYFNILSP